MSALMNQPNQSHKYEDGTTYYVLVPHKDSNKVVKYNRYYKAGLNYYDPQEDKVWMRYYKPHRTHTTKSQQIGFSPNQISDIPPNSYERVHEEPPPVELDVKTGYPVKRAVKEIIAFTPNQEEDNPAVFISPEKDASTLLEFAGTVHDLNKSNGGGKKRRKTRKTRKTRKNKKRKSKKSKKNIKKKAPTKKRKLRKNKKTKRKKGGSGSDSDAEMDAEIDEAMKLNFDPNEPVPPLENMWKNYSDEPGLTSSRTGRFKVIPKTRHERMLETLNRNRTASYNVANFEKNKRANKEKKERELRDQAETSRQIHGIETDLDIYNANRNQWLGEVAKNQSLVGLQHNFNRASSAPQNLSPQEKEDQDRFEPEQGPFGKQSVRKKQKRGS